MNAQYLQFLKQQAEKYLTDLEELFGPRDPRYVFRSIEKSTHPEGDPQTHFPFGYSENGCVIDIHISPEPYNNEWPDQSTWQIAHECVHLLNPCRMGDANFLEEGLATWFQDELRFHNEDVQTYIQRNRPHTPNYAEAKALVKQCMPELIAVVHRLRSHGVRLKDFKSELLKDLILPGKVDEAVFKRLCTGFPVT